MTEMLTEEVRTKLEAEQHRLFDALTRARQESMAERMRELIAEWVESEIHAHTLRTRLLKGEGVLAEVERK